MSGVQGGRYQGTSIHLSSLLSLSQQAGQFLSQLGLVGVAVSHLASHSSFRNQANNRHPVSNCKSYLITVGIGREEIIWEGKEGWTSSRAHL